MPSSYRKAREVQRWQWAEEVVPANFSRTEAEAVRYTASIGLDWEKLRPSSRLYYQFARAPVFVLLPVLDRRSVRGQKVEAPEENLRGWAEIYSIAEAIDQELLGRHRPLS